ncbi:hypothetical protein LEP1GSC021_0475 [Leptospira noguchii str. 1993005606]|nr:hypothetical protein LEP1GSC021_0475 [Leptospira noguchii str. 1993005606]
MKIFKTIVLIHEVLYNRVVEISIVKIHKIASIVPFNAIETNQGLIF